jgi:hypothetical protein
MIFELAVTGRPMKGVPAFASRRIWAGGKREKGEKGSRISPRSTFGGCPGSSPLPLRRALRTFVSVVSVRRFPRFPDVTSIKGSVPSAPLCPVRCLSPVPVTDWALGDLHLTLTDLVDARFHAALALFGGDVVPSE